MLLIRRDTIFGFLIFLLPSAGNWGSFNNTIQYNLYFLLSIRRVMVCTYNFRTLFIDQQ